MLKFKEIKKSIMQPRDRHVSPLIDSHKPNDPHPALAFKMPYQEQYQECSPIGKTQQINNYCPRYDTQAKRAPNPFMAVDIKTDTKENNPRHMLCNPGPTFAELSAKKLEFAPKRKVAHHADPVPAYRPQKSHENSASKHSDTLSFATLLSSKKPSNNSKSKFYLDSDRKNDRESSISKLKDKLFGMKRVISEKDRVGLPHTPKAFSTNREQDYDQQDLVKISMARQSFPHELDMSPFF